MLVTTLCNTGLPPGVVACGAVDNDAVVDDDVDDDVTLRLAAAVAVRRRDAVSLVICIIIIIIISCRQNGIDDDDRVRRVTVTISGGTAMPRAGRVVVVSSVIAGHALKHDSRSSCCSGPGEATTSRRQTRRQRLQLSINQSIKQVYCTEPRHTYTINLTNKNKREKQSHT